MTALYTHEAFADRLLLFVEKHAIPDAGRFARGVQLVQTLAVEPLGKAGAYQVATHRVTVAAVGDGHLCNCPDFEHRMSDAGRWCKHIWAALIWRDVMEGREE